MPTQPKPLDESTLSLRAKLSIAAWLESNTGFRLPNQATDLPNALQSLASSDQGKSYLSQAEQLHRYFVRGLWLIVAGAFILGLFAVPPAFAVSSSGTVNIFWLLIVMLGFHGINLIAWLIGMLALGRNRNQSKGFLLSVLIFVNHKISKHSHIKTDLSSAFWHWQCPAHSNRWLLSSLSHTAWLSYLLAGFLMTLLLLLTKQVNFVWETTLLGDQQFLWLTQQLSLLPQWLGISVPNQLDLVASRVNIISQTATTRQHWANLLLASLFFYGVIPRLLLSLFSLFMYRLKRLTLPKSAQEQAIERRYQEQINTQILDSEKHKSPQHKAEDIAQHGVTPIPNDALRQIWGLFEWSLPVPEPLAQAQQLITLNDAAEQQDFLTGQNSQPVYILVDGDHSPDRGSRRFLLKARNAHPNVFFVIANGQHALFTDDWQRTALESGFRAEHCFSLSNGKE